MNTQVSIYQGMYWDCTNKNQKNHLSTLVTPVLIMTSTSANMNLVKKVYGGVKNRVNPPRSCPLCIPVTQLTREMANRV
jgi:hypothetical protein